MEISTHFNVRPCKVMVKNISKNALVKNLIPLFIKKKLTVDTNQKENLEDFLKLVVQMKILFPDTMNDDSEMKHDPNVLSSETKTDQNMQKTATLAMQGTANSENVVTAEKIFRPIDSNDTLQIAKLSDNAIIPTRQSLHAAGFDLYSAYDYILPALSKILVKTDIQICLPIGTYGRIAPRSGLAWKYHIDIGAGVVDNDYRGNVSVLIFNHSVRNYKILAGHRIAQLICEKILTPKIIEVELLDNTVRGTCGFGSTGLK